MGAIRDQFRWKKLKLQDDNASDFYLSCWQRNRMAMPMLCIRLVLFAGCLGILLSSMLLPERIIYIAYWPLYLTQWGLLMNLITTGMATAVSAVAYFKGPIGWYVLYLSSITLLSSADCSQRKYLRHKTLCFCILCQFENCIVICKNGFFYWSKLS